LKARKVIPYLLIAPHGIFFGIFVIFPIFKSLFMSFTEWGLFQRMVKFVGWENYYKIFDFGGYRSRYFWKAVWVTLEFVAITVPALVIVAILLALLLNSKFLKGKSFALTSFFLPTALAVTVIAVIWRWLLNYDAGLMNYVLSFFGLDKIPWLTSLPWALISIVVATVWWTVGWNVIIVLGGLQKIPATLYDAARVDGAGIFQRFWHVTLPGLKNVLMFVVITQIIASFGIFGQPQLMTNGGPGRGTLPIMLHIYQEAFNTSRPRMGYAAAMSIIFGIIVLGVTFIQYYLFTKEKKGGVKVASPQ
jgi:multiple sugar transport system permease protein